MTLSEGWFAPVPAGAVARDESLVGAPYHVRSGARIDLEEDVAHAQVGFRLAADLP